MTSAPAAPGPFDVVDAEFLASAADEASLPPPTLAEIAFAGRSNVGKSSAMNALMQRRGLVRTSSTPGCTRAINLFKATTREGLVLQLVDLPGYGFARRSKDERRKWGTLLESYLLERPTLRAVIAIIDARRGIEDDDLDLLDFCDRPRAGNAPIIALIVATKLDLLSKAKRKPTVAAIEAAAKRRVIGFSASTGEGREPLWRAIRRAAIEGTAPNLPKSAT